MEKKGIKKRWIILIMILVPFLPQVPGCIMANTPKVGRVVDVSTGKGMPNVTVIAAAKFFAHSFAGSREENIYRVIMHTDADGNYWIPSTWLDTVRNAGFSLPGGDPHIKWFVSAFEPGYAFVGDDEAWTEFDEYGVPRFWPHSVIFSPQAEWGWLVVHVEPLELQPVSLTLKQAAVYYRAVFLTGFPHIDRWNDPEEVALRKKGYDFFLPKICSLDFNEAMDSTESGAILSFVLDKKKSFERLKQLEPETIGKEIYARPQYKSGNVCEAMKAGGVKL